MSHDLSQTSIYDEVPYPSLPFACSHPDRLAAVALLAGVEPPPLEHCRILELGCAAAGNLLPIAASLPDSRCLGIDLSSSQIELAQRTATAAGLANVELRAINLLELDATLGEFDFILCHGVYSWSPPEVQQRILEICAQHLAPHGLAYLNYNTYPGWHFHGLARDLLQWYVGDAVSPNEKVHQARELIGHVLRAGISDQTSIGQVLKLELEPLQKYEDAFLFHAYLNVVNRPVYWHEFVARLRRLELHHLADADLTIQFAGQLQPQFRQYWEQAEPDWERRQQIFDYLFRRSSRQSVVGRRPVVPRSTPSPEALRRLRFTANLIREPRTPGAAPTFRSRSGKTVTTAQVGLARLLEILSDQFPESRSLGELPPECQMPEVLADLGSCLAAGFVELSMQPARCTRTIGDRPRSTALARYQAATGQPVANLRHQGLMLGDHERSVLELLDGTRDRAGLHEELMKRGQTSIELGGCLERLAANGLLLAGASAATAADPVARQSNSTCL